MEPKDGALGLAGSSALLLAMGLFTGGIAFYAFFFILSTVLIAGWLQYAMLASDLKRNLSVNKRLPRREVLLGSPAVVEYELAYRGRRRLPVRCEQRLDPALSDAGLSRQAMLEPGSVELSFEARPARRGSYRIPGLSIAFETVLFRGSAVGGGEDAVNVCLRLGRRSSRSGRSSGLRASVLENESIRRGSGVDFSRVRDFVPGDSTRNIDWARSSRTGNLVVRDFEDVHSLPVFILVDLDASMRAGLDAALELAGLIANRVLADNERVGIAGFSRQAVEAFLPPGSGKGQVAQLRSFLSYARAVESDALPRHGMPGLQEAAAAQEMLGDAGDILGEAMRQHLLNVKEDGFIRAITAASTTPGTACHLVVITNLSMGATSLLNGLRVAEYYGHGASVALVPALWFGDRAAVDAGKYFEKYREFKDRVARLRARRISVVELSAGEPPEEALYAGRRRAAGMKR